MDTRIDPNHVPGDEAVADVNKVVVIGTGFIGLPLALLLADNGKEVVGIDIDEKRVSKINDRSIHINEDRLSALFERESVQENLQAQTNVTSGDAFVVSVPTPLRQPQKSPDLSHLEAAIESILPHLRGGELITIESTIPPLTCSDVVTPILESEGFVPGENVQLAHAPERILPGNVLEEIVTNDRVIGGADEVSVRRAAKIYEPFHEGDIYYTDLISAEICKIIENTYRDVNVALANELAMIADEIDRDVDITSIIDIANEHPRVDLLRPGIGVGGHCLPVDPWFINEAAPEYTDLITTSRRINDRMPQVTARRFRRTISEFSDPTILALGAAYKPNTYDTRNSPAIEIVSELREEGFRIEHFDRHVDGMGYESVRSLVDQTDPDVLLVLVAHNETLEALEENRSWLKGRNVELLWPVRGDPLNIDSIGDGS